MRSLLFKDGQALQQPDDCAPGRKEVTTVVRKNGRMYTMVMRDKIVPEDPLFVLVKAAAFSIRTGEPYMGRSPERSLKDFLIRTSAVT